MTEALGQGYLICGWLEAILYGLNCMLFGYCMHVLLSSSTSSRRILTTAAVVQFSLSTAHVIFSLVELLEAFSQGNPDVYYSNPGEHRTFVAGFFIYFLNTIVQELLLIWRLYGLSDRQPKISVIPFGFWIAHVCVGLIAVSSFIPSTATFKYLRPLGLSGWALETVTNVTTNFGIAYHLWKAERGAAFLGTQGGANYRAIMLLVIECGALITTCTVTMFGLFASGRETGLVGVGIATQIATISPLIIVARVGLSQTQSRRSGQMTGTYPLQINITHTEDTYGDHSPEGARKPPHIILRDEDV